jgi:fatty-acyl-CoA synthase
VAYTLADAGAEILIVHRDFLPLYAEIRDRLPALRAVVVIQDGEEADLPSFANGEYEALLAQAPSDFAFRDFDENAVATTFYTSGTTGNPKGLCFTHRQLVIHTLVTCVPSGLTQNGAITLDAVYMPLTPMFHVHAWGMPYVATMLGWKQVYPGRYDLETICRLRRTEGVTYSHGVPTILRMLLDAAARTNTDLAGWTMGIGGSALSPALYEEGIQRGMKLVAGYGLSETCPSVTVARQPGTRDRAPSAMIAAMTGAGVPYPLVYARIVDEDMRDLPSDGQSRGELVLRTPWLASCYLGDEAASDALWRGGWMHTQDVATIDEHGRITICDRLKDVIKSGGEWVASLDLERIIALVPGVHEVAVVGVPDARWGERPIAVIVPSQEGPPSLDAVNAPLQTAASRGAISRYARVDRLEVVAALPRTSVGKIDQKALRSQFADPPPAVDRE